MVKSCSTLPNLFVFCVFAKVQSCFVTGFLISPFYRMSFLPETLTPALLRSCHRKVISHSNGHSVVGCRRKQKKPITQNIRNRRAHSSRFKVMFYVIGSEDQSRVLLHTAPANRTKGVVEQFGTSGVPIPCRMNRPMVEHWYSVVYVADHRCATIIQIHHLSVKFLDVSHYIWNFRGRFSTGSEKDPSTG